MKHIYNLHFKKIKIPPLTVFFIIFLIAYDFSFYTLITLASALLHEIGHAAAAFFCDVRIEKITVFPFGADIELSNPLRSYKKDIIITSAGAAVNLITAAVLLLFPQNIFVHYGFLCNIVLAATNLLPVEGLDGGGILKSLISEFSDDRRACAVLKSTSFIGLLIMWVISVYVLFVTDGNPSLFIIAVSLFVSVFLRRGRHSKREENRG